MKTVIIIPARYASTRYPGKPLVTLDQGDGSRKSLIQMSWEAAQGIKSVAGVYVATDDTRIAEAARAFGAEVLMTSDTCRNGTERVAEAAEQVEADIYVNLQGDAPLTPPWFLDALIGAMDGQVQMATPVLKCDAQTYANFTEDRRAGRVGGTTAVFSRQMDALYFSKEVIPYLPEAEKAEPPVYHHVGVYAYTCAALEAYMGWDEGPLERLEGLEQLRFLENGHKVRCVEVDARGRVFWELNNPEDVPRIEAVLKGSRDD